MELPARLGAADIYPVEAIAEIYADGAERRNDCRSESGSPEEPGGIPLACGPVDVSGIEESTDVQGLTDPRSRLHREGSVGLAERPRGRPVIPPRSGIEAVGRNGELLVPAKRDSVLYTPERVEVLIEGAGVAEDKAGLCCQTEHELH